MNEDIVLINVPIEKDEAKGESGDANDEIFFEHQTITQEDFFIQLEQGASVKHRNPHPMRCWKRGSVCWKNMNR